MTMEIKKAVRKAIPFIGCFYGKSGGGKTYSAIKLATGLVSGDKVCLIDTENGRASHYADDFDNLYILDLEPPFTPGRYIEAIKTAERAGYKAIIIDSISHEWEGIGGCLEMAEGKTGLLAWAKPKEQHRKLMNMLLQSKSHVIFCARAKEEMEQVKDKAGKTEIIKKGIIPIQEKNFPFEMLVTFRMAEKGKVVIEKCIKSLESSLKINEDEFVSEKHGKMIADWIEKGEAVDLEVKRLKEDAREVAMSQGESALITWFSELSEDDQIIAKRFNVDFKRELTKIARDRDNSEVEGRIKTGSISVSALKNGAKEPEFEAESTRAADNRFYREVIQDPESEVDQSDTIFKKHETAIKSYQNEKSLNAHFNYLNTKQDLEYLQKNNQILSSKLNILARDKREEFKKEVE